MKTEEALGLINQTIRGLKAYHLEPEDIEIKLNQNENPFDWPRPIKEEVARFCVERPWNRYPPFIPDGLRNALASYAGAPLGSVIVGNGSNEMLLVLLLSLAKSGTKVVLCQPTFTVYRLLADALGASPIVVPLDHDLRYDIPGIERAVQAHPGSLLIICSPNNPTGGVIDESEIRRIMQAHTGFCVLDQAYVEFGGFDAVPLLSEFPNLIVTRTFSKAFAGAGLRIGYLVGTPAVVGEMTKVKLPYNINFFSEHVASVMLQNRSLLADGLSIIRTERDRLDTFLRALPFDKVYPSAANFILVRCREKGKLFPALKRSGVLVRDVSGYPMLENCLRLSVGSPAENSRLKESIAGFFVT